MDTLALRAARCLGQSATASRSSPQEAGAKRPWKRAARTRAAETARSQAIDAAISVLKKAGIVFAQPLPGKFVVEPRAGVAAAQIVTFWPARERLRLGNRPTQRGRNIHAFEQAILDQGHHIPGRPDRVPTSRGFLQLEQVQAERIRRWLEQQAALEEAKSALDECILLNLQRLCDFAVGHRIESQDPDLREAKRRFRSARRRAMGRGVGAEPFDLGIPDTGRIGFPG